MSDVRKHNEYKSGPKERSYHLSHLTSSDLVSNELHGCEVTQFAVVVTNQNAVYVAPV